MNEHLLVLLVCLVVIVMILHQILAHTHNMDLSLRQQRRVLYDAHKRISSVTKGVGKPTS